MAAKVTKVEAAKIVPPIDTSATNVCAWDVDGTVPHNEGESLPRRRSTVH